MTTRTSLIFSAVCSILVLASCANPQGSADPQKDPPSDSPSDSPSPKTVSVTYLSNNADSGSVPVDAKEYEPGAAATVAGNTGVLARTYYEYAGWNTKSDGTGVAYKDGDVITIGSADLKLYAAWYTEEAAFTYDPSSGTGVTITGYGYNGKITEVIIPPTIGGLPVTAIADQAFYSKGNMVSVRIPTTVTSIGNLAFAACSGLRTAVLPAALDSIGDEAFTACTALQTMDLPPALTSIGQYAFNACESLASVVLPASLTYLGSSAFYGCASLASVVIPASLTSIGSSAFNNCIGLASATIEDGLVSIPRGLFSGCRNLTSMIVPPSVTSIGDYAFSSCIGLSSVTIPSSVTTIGTGAFANCQKLPAITIPSSVTDLASRAFYGCSLLTSVHVQRYAPGDDPAVTRLADVTVFQSSPAGRVYYVPAAAAAVYAAAPNWGSNEFGNPRTIQGE